MVRFLLCLMIVLVASVANAACGCYNGQCATGRCAVTCANGQCRVTQPTAFRYAPVSGTVRYITPPYHRSNVKCVNGRCYVR